MKSAIHRKQLLSLAAFCTLGFAALTAPVTASHAAEDDLGLVLPKMSSERGKDLFTERGCVVCHSVNNVGGDIAPSLDASNLNQSRNPFEFFARMWRGADAMLHLQQADLGYQVDFSGQDLADIFAFTQDADMQERLTQSDLPEHIREIIDNGPSIPGQ
ncbi:c-type cytochrome [Thalassospira lucentensis]|nr:c-type cytochrome [Thalassospira lucentensis]